MVPTRKNLPSRGASGDRDRAAGESALREDAEMGMAVAVVRRRKGLLVGGDEGMVLIDAADRAMTEQCIRNAERVLEVFAPGFR